jgi:hypothetical protein
VREDYGRNLRTRRKPVAEHAARMKQIFEEAPRAGEDGSAGGVEVFVHGNVNRIEESGVLANRNAGVRGTEKKPGTIKVETNPAFTCPQRNAFHLSDIKVFPIPPADWGFNLDRTDGCDQAIAKFQGDVQRGVVFCDPGADRPYFFGVYVCQLGESTLGDGRTAKTSGFDRRLIGIRWDESGEFSAGAPNHLLALQPAPKSLLWKAGNLLLNPEDSAARAGSYASVLSNK